MASLRQPPLERPALPELLEVELYRVAATYALNRTIRSVRAEDSWYLKNGSTRDALLDALEAQTFTTARRIGKLLLLDIGNGHTLGLRFGMTGKLVVTGDFEPPVELVYSSGRTLDEWNRFEVLFDDGGSMAINDPRRLGGVELDPDEGRLGVDAASITLAQLRDQLAKGRGPLKGRLMDQSRIAGVGNLIADETLWRAGLDPARPAGSLTSDEQRRLADQLRRTVKLLTKRGGSHTGDLFEHRMAGSRCPKDGASLTRRTVAGRTTYSCPQHQV